VNDDVGRLPLQANLAWLRAAQEECTCALDEIDRAQRLIADAADRLIGNWAALRGDLEHQRTTLLSLLQDTGPGGAAPAALSSARRVVEQQSRAIAQRLDTDTVALQFQDVTRQLLETTARRLEAMQRLLHSTSRDDAGAAAPEQAVHRGAPVAQATLDPGSIEIF